MVQREATGQPQDIFFYTYTNQNGIYYLYENKTADKTLQENVEFTLTGCTIKDMPEHETKVELKLQPGEVKLIQLIRNEDESCRTQMSYSYIII